MLNNSRVEQTFSVVRHNKHIHLPSMRAAHSLHLTLNIGDKFYQQYNDIEYLSLSLPFTCPHCSYG